MAREMTTKAQEAVSSALQAAAAAGNPQVEPIHLLEALIEQREGIALSLLEAVAADVRAIGARTRNALVHSRVRRVHPLVAPSPRTLFSRSFATLASAPRLAATSTSRPSIC